MQTSVLEHIKHSVPTEQRQIFQFAGYFGVVLQRDESQGPGTTGDCVILKSSEQLDDVMGYPCLGKRVEFKSDNKSRYTHNMFLEYTQTSNGAVSFNTSGGVKAVRDGCILVQQVYRRDGTHPYLMFDEASLTATIGDAFKSTRTKSRSNGNPVTLWQWGHLVKVHAAEKHATYTFCV